MPTLALNRLNLAALGALAILASAAALAAHSAAAQSANGTVTGRVFWGNCARGLPVPLTPDAQGAPGVSEPQLPDVQPVPAPAPGGQGQVEPNQAIPGRPVPAPLPQPTGLPAGAVLVAIQNTPISARTDETGRFSLSNVPSGVYMTVAAGPVGTSMSATADRPNVFVSAGQSVDIGTLALGGSSSYGIGCRLPMGPEPAPGAPAEGAP